MNKGFLTIALLIILGLSAYLFFQRRDTPVLKKVEKVVKEEKPKVVTKKDVPVKKKKKQQRENDKVIERFKHAAW